MAREDGRTLMDPQLLQLLQDDPEAVKDYLKEQSASLKTGQYNGGNGAGYVDFEALAESDPEIALQYLDMAQGNATQAADIQRGGPAPNTYNQYTQGAGSVDINALAQENPEIASQYLGGSEGGAGLYGTPDFSGLTSNDWSQVGAGVNKTIADTEADRKAAETESRFGNDTSWLDDMFQQDPTEGLKQAQGMGTSADPELAKQQQGLVDEIRGRGITADESSRQAQQGALDELMGIYHQGGQTARDKNLRAKARAESENWLKGQREADQQDLAERGGLGSGAELLTMLGDRQDAASRLSAADLQTSADSEQRALDALLSGSQLAGSMEGEANRYKQTNDATAGGLMAGMRSAGDAYVQNNADMINQIGQTNKNYLRDAQQKMIDRRDSWNRDVMQQQTDMAKYLADLDARENQAGYGFGYNTTGNDTTSRNQSRDLFNGQTTGAYTGQTPAVRGAGNFYAGLQGDASAHAGQAFTGAANFVGNLFSGLYGGGGGQKQDPNKKQGQ